MRRGRGRGERLLELAGYWLEQRSDGRGAGYYYACWYDAGRGRNRRVSLKTAGRAEAEKRFAAFVATRPLRSRLEDVPSPRQVLLFAVFEHYLRARAAKLRSRGQAETAVAYVQEFLVDVKGLPATIKADGFGLDLQMDFVRWCADKRGHSAAYIARMLNPISAAMHFAAKEQAVEDPAGGMRTVKLMSEAPVVHFYADWVAKTAGIAAPQKRDWVPEVEQMARFIDCIGEEHVFRFWMILLNTWARPEAVMELDLRRQVRERAGLVDLNPGGRLQTLKRRPIIRLTRNLAAWRAHWLAEAAALVEAGKLAKELVGRPIRRGGRAVEDCKKAIELASCRWMFSDAGLSRDEIERLTGRGADKARWHKVGELRQAGFEPITPRIARTFMATTVTNLNPEIEAQIATWLGHREQTTTSLYQLTNRNYLRAVAELTDKVIDEIAGFCKRPLAPAPTQSELPLGAPPPKRGRGVKVG